MFKAVTLATLSTVALAQYPAPQYGSGYAQPAQDYAAPQYGAYGAPQYVAPQYGAPQYGAPQYGAASSYQQGYAPHQFHKPGPLMDPKYYKDILSNFKQCKSHKCDKLGRGYSTDIKESISVLGAYTSCVTACAAEEVFRSVQHARAGLAKLNDIGFAQLTLARKYLGGQGDYDVIGNCTRIDDSCCLPEDYFTSWDRIMIPVDLTGINDLHHVTTTDAEGVEFTEGSLPRMVSVSAYLKKCTRDSADVDVEWLDHVRFNCETTVVEYLEILRSFMVWWR